MSLIDTITENPALAANLSADERRRVMLQCSAVLAALSTSLEQKTKDRLLSSEQAAERLGVTKWKLYKVGHKYPFARKDGGRWLFSEQGIDAWIAGKR
jgi:excisionase family DNA binding protein